MSDRRRGLGRGLGALIPAAPQSTGTSPSSASVLTPERGVAAAKVTGLVDRGAAESAPPVVDIPVSRETEPDPSPQRAPVEGAYFAELELDAITPNPRQPREVFDEDALNELIASIKEVGLLQPVVVRQIGTDRFELIMGERRWRACREAGLERIPAIVRATDDEKLLLDALLENLHRAQLNPLEEAAAYDQLLRDFACTHEQLADRIGRSRSQVSNTLRLLKLSAPVQRRVAAGVISFGHARALLGLDDAEEQDKLANRVVAEGLSVRSVEEIVMMMNGDDKPARKAAAPRAGKRISPALTNLASRLSDRFETRVKVDLGQKRGKIVVEFASIEDLERILGAMAPGEGKVLESRLDEEPEDDDAE
ncbi:chromosome partitioning protein, ParB family [Streptomyces sp. DvalAA-14]|uniref:ParB/RepB/Spo0J family partition protein n=1 Tax=unclassified Streptomyces TaxID=2593676 RepID=UPI00081B90D5|nr:ParB/RepB/Spo0J family partition protein [Streptomyces sp. DvalAA-14]MYS20396.1 ParB/RepB/Spo0J family partition protein [Streptomyces sp. SID4948]SCD68093.1 chromosome partitioning protein, ParB family [Streptomyces sp. DvalAA-14]